MRGLCSLSPFRAAADEAAAVAIAAPTVAAVLLEGQSGAAAIGVRDGGGWLPVHLAAMYSSSPAVVGVLLAAGGRGQLTARDGWGRLPSQLAERMNGCPAVALLLNQ